MRRLPFILGAVVLFTSGCGLYTPDIQEFWGTPEDAAKKTKAVVTEVTCEVSRALDIILKKDKGFSGVNRSNLDWLRKDWGVDIVLVITIDEKSVVNPNISFNTPVQNAVKTFALGGNTSTPQSYSFNVGGQLSADGYRQEKVHIFHKVSELVEDFERLPNRKDVYANGCPSYQVNASLFVQSDLKIYDWLDSMFEMQEIETVNFNQKDPLNKDSVLSDEIRFEIVSSGGVTPTWKLIDISANTSNNPLFNASRDRTQDVTITLGPAKDGSLSTPQGQISTFTSELNATARSLQPGRY